MLTRTMLILLLVISLVACAEDVLVMTPTSEPTPTAVSTAVALVPTATPSPSPTPTNTPSLTPTPSYTPTATSIPTATPTPSPIPIAWVALGTQVPVGESPIRSDNGWQIQELARWGRGTIVDIDLSADGQWIAVATGGGVYIHRRADLTAEPWQMEIEGGVSSITISPQGDTIAIIGQGDRLQVWQVEPFQQLFEVPQTLPLRFFADSNAARPQFSPDGTVLAIAHTTGVVELRDSKDGAILASYSNAHYSNVRFSPNGSKIALWDRNNDLIVVYDWIENRQLLIKYAPIHPPEEGEYQALIADVVFMAEDDIRLLIVEGLASISRTGRLEIQDVSDDPLLFSIDRIPYLSGATSYVCNEPVVYWDPPEPPTPDHMEIASESQIAAMRYTGVGYSGDYAVYSSMQFYHVVTGQQLYVVEEGVVDFELAPDGETWVAGLQDGRLQIRQLRDGAVLESVDAYEAPVLDVTLSPNNQWVGATYVDEVKIFQREDGQILYRYPATHVDFAPNSQSFALGYENGTIELRDTSTGELISQIVAHPAQVSALRYLPSGELLSSGFDCNPTRWQTPNLTPLNTLENFIVTGFHTEEPVPVRIGKFLPLPDGQTVIGLFLGYGFATWSIEDGRLLYASPEDAYGSLSAISPRNQFVIAHGSINELWDDSFTLLLETSGKIADFSADGSLLAISTERYDSESEIQRFIQLWHVPDMTLLYTERSITAHLAVIRFTPDGRLFLSGALDGIIRLWGIP